MIKTWVVLAAPEPLHYGAQRVVVAADTAQGAINKAIEMFNWQRYEYFMVRLRDGRVWE